MKKYFSLSVLTIVSCFVASAQTRYLDDTYFSTVQVDTGIQYGSNVTYLGLTQNLFLDFYQPSGDTASARPLIIWIHGGGYTTGTRTDSHMQLWCNEFARRGYVAASIDYRLGISTDANGKLKAIYRSVQDAKAVIRFFRLNASTYKIDVNRIVIAGSSVGAFAAMHTAYWDADEVPSAIDTLTLGNLEGNSGNPGYASNPNAVVNFWGALKDSTWIDSDEPPIVSCAGILDSVVYPESHTWPTSGDEYGSIVVDRVAKSKGIPDTLRIFYGAKHTLAGGSGSEQVARWDTATTFVSEFLYCNLIESCTTTSIPENNESEKIVLYPNPSQDNVINLTGLEYADLKDSVVEIINSFGQVVDNLNYTFTKEGIEINISEMQKGIYFILIYNSNSGSVELKKLIRQ